MIKTEIQIWYGIFCDECDAPGPYSLTAEKAIEKAKKQGWLVVENGLHFCPRHTETTKAILAELGYAGADLDRLLRREEERAKRRAATKPDGE